MRYELVALEPGEDEELVAEGSRSEMEAEKERLEADYREGGELEGEPFPTYVVQPAK